MKLYRGSRIKTDEVKAQKVFPVDHSKFNGEIPEKVIWAIQYENMAWVFGIYWQRMSVKINTTTKNGKTVHEVQVERDLTSKELKETVYLYTVDGGTFHPVGVKGSEWYSFEDKLPAEREERKVGDALDKLRNSERIVITINPSLGISPSERK